MNERIRLVTHKQKKILLFDFTACTPDEVESLCDDIKNTVTRQPRNSVLALADFTGAKFTREAVARMKEALVFDKPHVHRSAWVGVDSMPKVFYDAVKSFSRRELPSFKTREEALDWLVES
jgi:SpoIIAA-like